MIFSKKFSSVSQLFSYIDTVYEKGDGPALHFFIVLPNDRLTIEELENTSKDSGALCEINKTGESIFSFILGPRKLGDMGYLIQEKRYWIFITDMEGIHLKAFLRKSFPLLSLAYINSEMLLDIIKESEKNFYSIKFLEGTFCKSNESFRNWKKKPIRFSKKELIQLAEKQGFRWTALSILVNNENYQLKFRISNKGEITFYRGTFEKFYTNFIMSFISKSMQFKKFMSNRERKIKEGKVEIFPIKIDFKKELSMNEIKIVRENLIRKYIPAVIYSGNPVLMMQVTDKKEGSSFDVFASKKRLKITPLLKSSPASLTELFNNIINSLPSGNLRKK